MPKSYKKIIWRSLLAVLGIIICYNAYLIASFLWWEPLLSDELSESKSPANLGSAAFLRESAFTDSSVYFYVRDPARKTSGPLLVGGPYATDGDMRMKQAVWSRDGSVIAVRADVGNFGWSKKVFATLFVDAYDFRLHRKVADGSSRRQKSQRIKLLLAQRGGEGRQAIYNPYASGEPLSTWQSRQFKR